jgi:hypothetical protein
MKETMNVLATTRNLRSWSARSTLAAATVAWLGFLLQPCVMAAPLAGTVDVAHNVELSIVSHLGPDLPPEQCLHCDNAGDLLPGTCDDIVVSGSASNSKPVDGGTDGSNAAAPPATIPATRQIVSESVGLPRAEHLPPSVAFTEAYCVYLE